MAENALQAFYRSNPRMVSSPFGGIDGIHEALLAGVFGRLGIAVEGTALLDVGCGRGYLVEWAARHGARATGLDFVISRGGFPLAQGDAAALPFAADTFDVLCCLDASEHFPRPEAAAREFLRVLKPGGTFFLSAPNYGNVAGVVKWYYERFGGYAPDTWAPFGRWQPQELEQPLTARSVRRLYAAAGFTGITAVGHAPEVYLGLCPWIDHPRCPERIRYRMQDMFGALGPAIVNAWPGASLHLFWRMRKPG